MKFPGAVKGRGIEIDVVVNVALVGMGADEKLVCVGQMPPRKERAALHGYALVVVYDFVRGVACRLGERADVNGPLGGIILVKAGGLNLRHLDGELLLVVFHPLQQVLLQRGPVTAIMPPLILPCAVFVIVAGPRHKGGRGPGMLPQRKAPAILQHDGL